MLAEDKGRVERRAMQPLARGVDVQLALENVVDDRLGQVIHDVAVPMLQGQPGGEEMVIRQTAFLRPGRRTGLPPLYRAKAYPTPCHQPLLRQVSRIPSRKLPLSPTSPPPSW